MRSFLALLSLWVSGVVALCPMAELSRRGLATPDLEEAYLQGRAPALSDDPLSGVLAPLGLGSMVLRQRRSADHERTIEDHVRSRLEERDENVDIDAAVLTPKAHKRFVEKRGLVGGILPPLTGVLSALDVPTPQQSGLKAIPGGDHAHRYIPPGPTDIRGDCPSKCPFRKISSSRTFSNKQ